LSPLDAAEARRSADVVYVVSEYPATSHSFVRREVTALRGLGLSITTVSLRRARQLISAADERENVTTIAIRPTRVLTLIMSHLAALRHSTRAYLKTVVFAFRRGDASPRSLLWQVFYFGQAIVLWNACRAVGTRHVHSHFANSGSDVGRLAKAFANFSGADWVWSFTMHGSAEFLDVKAFGLARKVEDADFVICISDYCRSQLMWLVDPRHWSKLFVIRCGVPVAHTRAVRPRDGRLAKLNVLCVGRLIGLKGHAVLIEAGRILSERGIDAEIRIAGAGPMYDRLNTLAQQRSGGSRVRLLGSVSEEDLDEQYAWADAFCLPSMMEGLPIVLMEAMASGVPVVATDITAVGELVQDGRSGLLVPPGRADAIADALERLALDPELRRRLSLEGRTRVQSDFDVGESARQLASHFRSPSVGTQGRGVMERAS
jgi:glycosyltransferase involved in cell wall biosynthesis